MVADADDPIEFWHQAIEKHRIDDDTFDEGVTLTLAMALVGSTSIRGPSEPERMLLRLREWYGHSMERRAVLTLLTHLKGDDGREPIWEVGHAVWATHQDPCPDRKECSLHSLGALWAHRWARGADAGGWMVDALGVLLQDHPLRGWARHLVSRLADCAADGSIGIHDVVRLLSSALDAGLAEHLPNAGELARHWSRLTNAASPEGQASLVPAGNRLIAGGLTCLIDPQLRLLTEVRGDSTT